jgi:hypothetical protein
VAVLGRNPREGDGLRWLEAVVWRGKRWGELGAREESERSGDGRTSGAASGEETAWRQRGRGGEQGKGGGCRGAWPRSAGDVRRVHACRSDREGRETSDGWAGTVPGGGAA